MLTPAKEKIKSNSLAALLSGSLISFVGSLPPGAFNLTTLHVSYSSGYATAGWLAAGGLVAEMVYVKVSLVMMNKISKITKLQNLIRWASLIILITMAISSFITASQGTVIPERAVAFGVPAFLAGFLLMAINPMQIPFWISWTTILYDKKILQPLSVQGIPYIIGAGLGSLLASILFILVGADLSDMQMSNKVIHLSLGGIFLCAFVWQGITIVRRGISTAGV